MINNFLHKKRQQLKFNLKEMLVLISGLSLFVFLALINITKAALWLDEAFTAYIIKFNFLDIVRYTAADVHPPLYYWLVKLWSMIFGNSELALRSMSVFFGVIAITFGYLLIRRLFNIKSAQLSLLFMVLSPMFLRYAQEARMYTLMVAIAISATYMLVLAMESKRRLHWVIYGILVSLGMWTHYFSAIVWIVHWLWRADVIRKSTGKKGFIKAFFSKDWLVAHFVATGVFLLWIPAFVYQFLIVQVSGFWIPIVSIDTIPNYITNAIFYLNSTETIGWLALGLVTMVVTIMYLSNRVYKSQSSTFQQSYKLLAMLSFMPMVMLFLLSMPPLRSLFIDRYLNTSALSMSMFFAVTLSYGLKYIKPKFRTIIILLIPLMMIYGIGSVWRLGNYNKISNTSSDTRKVIKAISSKSKQKIPVIINSPWLFYEAVFYETENNPVYFINEKTDYEITALDMLHYNKQNKIMDIKKFSNDNPIVWYVGSTFGGDLESPYSNWKATQDLSIDDSVTGRPEYKVTMYEIK